jgi:hypothetical protein
MNRVDIMKKTWIRAAAAAVLALAVFGCSSELSDSAAPVELVVTNVQNLNQIDLAGDPTGSTRCQETIATVNMQVIAKNPAAVGPFVDVRVTRYRVTYVRTDGGTAVPASFTRSVDAVLTTGGGAQSLSGFLAFESGALSQAPFAALFPNNGGRDPQTGRSTITMDVILEIFGQTLAGDAVYDSTRVPLDFCFNCNPRGCA